MEQSSLQSVISSTVYDLNRQHIYCTAYVVLYILPMVPNYWLSWPTFWNTAVHVSLMLTKTKGRKGKTVSE